MKTALEYVAPDAIERRSMEIIEHELGETRIDPENREMILRVIHTTADFDYVANLHFSPGAAQAGLEAIRMGACIVTDTQMAYAGIHKAGLTPFGGSARCFMGEDETARRAAKNATTRSAACMERAAELTGPQIVVVGNAPTALLRLCELIQAGKIAPRLVIGVPVGFVNVVASKEMLETLPVAHIVARGRKGGSNVAAALCNALIYKATGRSL